MVRKRLRAAACSVLLSCAVATGGADELMMPPAFSLTLSPSLVLPVGPGANLFLPGAAAELGAEYVVPGVPFLSVGGFALYAFTPIPYGAGTASQLSGLGGVAWRLPLVGRLSARFFGRVGYGWGLVNGDAPSSSGGGPVAEAGAGLSFAAGPAAVARLDVSYLYFLGANGDLRITAGLSFRPGAGRPVALADNGPRAGLEITTGAPPVIYPAQRRHYENHPLGTVVVRNTGPGPLEELEAGWRIAGLMEGRHAVAARGVLNPGESWEVPLTAVLDPAALAACPEGPADGEITVAYIMDGEPVQQRAAVPLSVMAPAALGVGGAAGMAAFIFPEDPPVRGLAAVVAAAVRLSDTTGAGRPLKTALAVREALRLLGVHAVAAPAVPAANGAALDPQALLRYPRQTLADRVGSPDDLALLTAALLEACGLESALARAGGRTLVAVQLESATTDAAADAGAPPVEAVSVEGRSWLFFDPAVPEEGFRAACRRARQWWGTTNTPVLLPLIEQWGTWPAPALPANLPAGQQRLPGTGEVRDALDAALRACRGAAGPAAPAAPAAAAPGRRLLLVFQAGPGTGISAAKATMLSDALAVAVHRADRGIVVIPLGGGRFPATDETRAREAAARQADCYAVVSLGRGPSGPVVSIRSVDLLSSAVAIDQSAPPAEDGTPPAPGNEPAVDWGWVAGQIAAAYGTR
jgi:hypothetical protein